jgi:hypothetical protein
MLVSTGQGAYTHKTTCLFKLKGSVSERFNLSRVEDDYLISLAPHMSDVVVKIATEDLKDAVSKTQKEYKEAGFFGQLKVQLFGNWFCEQVDTDSGYIKVGCSANRAVQINLPITLPVTEYPYEPFGRPKPHHTSKQANILVEHADLQEALSWCDNHINK